MSRLYSDELDGDSLRELLAEMRRYNVRRPEDEFQASLGSQSLGSSASIAANQTVELARVQMPTQLARCWSAFVAPQDNAAQSLNSIATLSWGTAGANFSAEVDVSRGQRVTVWGSYVALRVTGGPTMPAPITFVGALAPCASDRAGLSGVTRTVDLGSIAASGTAQGIVPAWAHSAIVVYGQSTVSTFNLEFWEEPALLNLTARYVYTGTTSTARPRYGQPVIVPPRSRVVRVQNADAGIAMQRTQVVFDLAL